MKPPTAKKKRGIRYRIETSIGAGVLVAIVLAFVAHDHAKHHPGDPRSPGRWRSVRRGLRHRVHVRGLDDHRHRPPGNKRARERERLEIAVKLRGRQGRRYARQG